MKTLLEGKHWTPSHSTDITETWRAHGWKPLAELQRPVFAGHKAGDDYDNTTRLDWLERGGFR